MTWSTLIRGLADGLCTTMLRQLRLVETESLEWDDGLMMIEKGLIVQEISGFGCLHLPLERQSKISQCFTSLRD